MRNTNRKRSLLISGSVILLCISAIVGMTYALFSDTAQVTHILQAGDLDITLVRTNLVTKSLDNTTGFLTDAENDEIVDFSNSTTRNVFDFDGNTRIVPGCEYTAAMQVSNNSDVAFAYWVGIVCADAEDEQKNALAEQLKVTVTTDTENDAFLSEGLVVGSSAQPIGILAKGASGEFTIKVEFLDLAENNAAKNQDLEFDLVVYAVQVTQNPAAP